MASSEGGARLKSAGEGLFKALSTKAVGSLGDRVTGLTDKLEDVASGNPVARTALGSATSAVQGESPTKGALKGVGSAIKDKIPGLGGGGGGGKGSGSPKATKATNIIESIDVGVPVRVAYNQWTEFGGFPSFMKKVENVEAQDDTKLNWKAQIVWSHRTWEASILKQIPEERIVWRSKGQKGHVDGAVTFHELGPNLTRILVVLEYYPQGLFERTGNIWRAQGRRARVELKHFRRHVMTRTILNPDEVEGWRGTIEDGEVTKSHEDAMEEEQQQRDEEEQQGEESGDDSQDQADESQDESDEDQPEDEYESDEGEESEEGEPEDEYDESEEEPEDEYESDEGEESEEGEPEDEYEEPDEADEGEESEEGEPDDEYEEPEASDEAEEPEDTEDTEEPEDEAAPEEEQEAPKPRSRRRRAS